MADVVVAVEMQKTLRATVYLRVDEAKLEASSLFKDKFIIPEEARQFALGGADDPGLEWDFVRLSATSHCRLATAEEIAHEYVADATNLPPLVPPTTKEAQP